MSAGNKKLINSWDQTAITFPVETKKNKFIKIWLDLQKFEIGNLFFLLFIS